MSAVALLLIPITNLSISRAFYHVQYKDFHFNLKLIVMQSMNLGTGAFNS